MTTNNTNEPTLDELDEHGRFIDDDDFVAELLQQEEERVAVVGDSEIERATAIVNQAVEAYDKAVNMIPGIRSGWKLACSYIGQHTLTLDLANETKGFLEEMKRATLSIGRTDRNEGSCYEDLYPVSSGCRHGYPFPASYCFECEAEDRSQHHRWGEGESDEQRLARLDREDREMMEERSLNEDDYDFNPSDEIVFRHGTVNLILPVENPEFPFPLPFYVQFPNAKCPSKRRRMMNGELNRRIRQLAKSWNCSIEVAEDRFDGFGRDEKGFLVKIKRPNHVFPVRRTRQFED